MFGIYRYILAFFVVLQHLWNPFNNWSGTYAVFGFYLLSGYLMTYSLNKNYGFNFNGIKSFFLNRILRIFPLYFIVIFIGVIMVSSYPAMAHHLNFNMNMPESLREWFKVLTLYKLNVDFGFRLVPPSWSLSVEFFFYIVLGLVLSRNKWIVYLWFAVSLSYTIYMIHTSTPWHFRYFPIFAASLPFSTGSLMYFLPSIKTFFKSTKSYFVILFSFAVLFLINIFFADSIWHNVRLGGFYISFILSAILTILLINLKFISAPDWLKKCDKFLGNLSYPIFLCHWSMAVFTYAYLDIRDSPQILLVSFILANIVSTVIYFVIDQNINRLRNEIRPTTSVTKKEEVEVKAM